MRYAEEHTDPRAGSFEHWDPVAFERRQLGRLNTARNLAYTVTVIPRRLGGDATDQELAADKKLAKRVLWRVETCMRQHGGDRALAKKPVQIPAGARVVWTEWWSDWKDELDVEIRTWANTIVAHGQHSEGQPGLRTLLLEMEQLTEVFEA